MILSNKPYVQLSANEQTHNIRTYRYASHCFADKYRDVEENCLKIETFSPTKLILN